MISTNIATRSISAPETRVPFLTDADHPTIQTNRMSQGLFTPQSSPDSSSAFNPVIPLRPGNSDKSVIACIPGAGASVTSFIHLLDALPAEYALYGLQPRGLDSEHAPDVSVEAAAEFNIRALATVVKDRWIHLIGHSHGGLIAFEMAQQWLAKGLRIASLTIVDSSAPRTSQVTPPDVTDAELRSAFIAAIEGDLGVSLGLNPEHIAHGTNQAFVRALHTAMVGVGRMPARSHADLLNGSLRTFAAAIRADYMVGSRYPGTVHLVTASATPKRAATHEERVARWQCVATEVDAWQGPGNHFSILRAPHVHALAQRWISYVNDVQVNNNVYQY
jgi:thioesterase domain-containing protein